jgi:hypothetical protein
VASVVVFDEQTTLPGFRMGENASDQQMTGEDFHRKRRVFISV